MMKMKRSGKRMRRIIIIVLGEMRMRISRKTKDE